VGGGGVKKNKCIGKILLQLLVKTKITLEEPKTVVI
jgi:hypothetical protein